MNSIRRLIFSNSIQKQTFMLNRACVTKYVSSKSESTDSHDDFKPQSNESSDIPDVFTSIKNDLSAHDVFIYMKGRPDAPKCGFSMVACKILDAYGVKYGSKDVLEDLELREGIKKYSNWPTIPQIFVKGDFVGGTDILRQMHENGELKQILKR